MRTEMIRRSRRTALGLVAALWLLSPLGCSISTSPSDSSESSSDSSASSSASSSPESKESAYRDDVRDYTAAYVKSDGQLGDFKKKLGELAKARGITNWEDSMVTYDGIGRGLAKAKVSQVELDTYAAGLSNGDPAKAQTIRKGYDSAKE